MVTYITQKRKYAIKALAVLSALVVIFIILSSLSYIAEHADHRCEGEHCSVCDAIRQCFDNLNAGADVKSYAFAAALTFAAVCLLGFPQSDNTHVTLITQKVRLNN